VSKNRALKVSKISSNFIIIFNENFIPHLSTIAVFRRWWSSIASLVVVLVIMCRWFGCRGGSSQYKSPISHRYIGVTMALVMSPPTRCTSLLPPATIHQFISHHPIRCTVTTYGPESYRVTKETSCTFYKLNTFSLLGHSVVIIMYFELKVK